MALKEDRIVINNHVVEQITWQEVVMEIGMEIRNFVWDRLIWDGC